VVLLSASASVKSVYRHHNIETTTTTAAVTQASWPRSVDTNFKKRHNKKRTLPARVPVHVHSTSLHHRPIYRRREKMTRIGSDKQKRIKGREKISTVNKLMERTLWQNGWSCSVRGLRNALEADALKLTRPEFPEFLARPFMSNIELNWLNDRRLMLQVGSCSNLTFVWLTRHCCMAVISQDQLCWFTVVLHWLVSAATCISAAKCICRLNPPLCYCCVLQLLLLVTQTSESTFTS